MGGGGGVAWRQPRHVKLWIFACMVILLLVSTVAQSVKVTQSPTKTPSRPPTKKPSKLSSAPSRAPIRPTVKPSRSPTRHSFSPTSKPTTKPTPYLWKNDQYVSCGSPDVSCPLTQILNAYPGNVTIVLASNVVLDSTIKITGSRRVTIWGALNIDFRPRLSASGDRLFVLENGGVLRLRNVQLKGGMSTDVRGGGAVTMKHISTLIAEDVEFLDNQATAGDGGAIMADNSTVFLNRCTFSNNKASMGDGGAVATSTGYLQISETSFIDNAAFFSGGAVRVSRSSLIMSNCTLVENIARSGGALAMSEMVEGAVLLSTFAQNDAAYGGALYTANGRVVLTSCTFSRNTAWDTSSEGIFVLQDPAITTGTVTMVSPVLINQTVATFVNSIQVLVGGYYTYKISPLADCVSQTSRYQLVMPLCTICPSVPMLPEPHKVLSCTCTTMGGILTIPLDDSRLSSTYTNRVFYPGVCFNFSVTSLFPNTCVTSGGYAAEGTACSLLSDQPYVGCSPVTAELPHVSMRDSLSLLPGNAGNDFWCPTVPRYSVLDDTKKEWGYCGKECGYAALDEDTFSAAPTLSPTSLRVTTPFPSASPSNASKEYEYEYEYEYEGYRIAPFMTSAVYVGYYGTYIQVAFDCITDCGGNCSAALPCTSYFKEADESWACRWTSRQQLAIFQSPAVFSLHLLNPNSITCVSDYVKSGFARGSIMVTGYGDIAPPSVVLVAPTVISQCATRDLVLDGTGSKVFSAGGIAWLRWELRWTEPTLEFYSGAVALLKSRLEVCSNALTLFCSTGLLPYAGRFAFALTIANFFGKSSTSSAIVEVEMDSAPIVIRFASGNMVLSRYSGDNNVPTQLEASVSWRSVCSTSSNDTDGDVENILDQSTAPLRVAWQIISPREIVQSPKALSALVTTVDPFVTSFYPARLGLSAVQPLPYDVTVRLTAYLEEGDWFQNDNMWSYSDLVVRVVETPLVLEIRNSNRTLSPSETSLQVIGQVTSGARFSQEHIDYTWNCSVINLNSRAEMPCPGLGPAVVNLTKPQLSSIFLSNVIPNSRYVFTFTAMGATPYRTASVSAFFKSSNMTLNGTIPPMPPVVVLQSNQQQQQQQQQQVVQSDNARLNRDRAVRVKGYCPGNVSLDWTLMETSFQKNSSHLLQLLPSAVITPPYVLGDGRYTLTLMCGQRSSESHVLFDVNNEPWGGNLVISPSAGTVFSTIFVMRALGWVDDEGDLPLRYSFEIVSASNTSRSLAPLSTWASWESRLPIGTVLVRNRAVDSLGAISDYVESPVTVTSPVSQSQYLDWFGVSCKRWRRDWTIAQRSGVEVLGEIGVSVKALDLVPLDASYVQILALGMIRVALKNMGNMVSDDDLTEDARMEILSRVLQDLVKFLAPQQASDELLEGLIDWQSVRMTSKGVTAVFEAAVSPLQAHSVQSPSLNSSIQWINCDFLWTKSQNDFPLGLFSTTATPNDTSTLRSDIILLAWETLECNTSFAKSLVFAVTPSPVSSSAASGSLSLLLNGRRVQASDTTTGTPSGETASPTFMNPSVDLETQSRIMAQLFHSFGGLSETALVDSLPGEDPVILEGSNDKTTVFQTWRLSAGTGKSFTINDNTKTNIRFEGPNDVAKDGEDVWFLSLNSSLSPWTATPNHTSLGSVLYIGGKPWNRWTRVRVRNISVGIEQTSLANLPTNATLFFLNNSAQGSILVIQTSEMRNITTLRRVNITRVDDFTNETTVKEILVDSNRTALVEFVSQTLVDIQCLFKSVSIFTGLSSATSDCQVAFANANAPDLNFDCVCDFTSSRRRLLAHEQSRSPRARRSKALSVRRRDLQVESDGYVLSAVTGGSRTASYYVGGIPIDVGELPGSGGVPGEFESSAPTFVNETRRPTVSPTFAQPLTIVNSQQSQAWVSILTILCLCLVAFVVGLRSMCLDRRDEARREGALKVAEALAHAHQRKIKRNFFERMRWAHNNNVFLMPNERRQAATARGSLRTRPDLSPKFIASIKREYLWRGFAKRHVWLAPWFSPFSPTQPRSTRVVALFCVAALNMGICAALLVLYWSNSTTIGLVSATLVSLVTWALDKAGRMWSRRKISSYSKLGVARFSTRSTTTMRSKLPSATTASTATTGTLLSSHATALQHSPALALQTISDSYSSSPARVVTHRIKTPMPEDPLAFDDRALRTPRGDFDVHALPAIYSSREESADEATEQNSTTDSWNEPSSSLLRSLHQEQLFTLPRTIMASSLSSDVQSGWTTPRASEQMLPRITTPRHALTPRGGDGDTGNSPSRPSISESIRQSPVKPGLITEEEAWSSWKSRSEVPSGSFVPSTSSFIPVVPPNQSGIVIIRHIPAPVVVSTPMPVAEPAATSQHSSTDHSSPVSSLSNPVDVKKETIRRSNYVLVISLVPLALVGWGGAAFAVTFNASLAGQAKFALWIQAWVLALCFDCVLLQVVLSCIRLGAAVQIHRLRLRRRGASNPDPYPTKYDEESGPAADDAIKFRWQVRSRTPMIEDDLMLMDAIVDAASVDTDTEARELLELILGATQMETETKTQYTDVDHYKVMGAGESSVDDRDASDALTLPLPPLLRNPFASKQEKLPSFLDSDEDDQAERESQSAQEDPSSDVESAEGNLLDLKPGDERIQHETVV